MSSLHLTSEGLWGHGKHGFVADIRGARSYCTRYGESPRALGQKVPAVDRTSRARPALERRGLWAELWLVPRGIAAAQVCRAASFGALNRMGLTLFAPSPAILI